LRTKTPNHRHNNGRHQNFPSERNNGMSRSTNSITAFRITQPADTFIWPAITFTRDNTALGRLTVRRTIAFVGGDFRVLFRFNLTSPFFTSMVQHSSAICLLFLRHKNVQSHWLSVTCPRRACCQRRCPGLGIRFCCFVAFQIVDSPACVGIDSRRGMRLRYTMSQSALLNEPFYLGKRRHRSAGT